MNIFLCYTKTLFVTIYYCKYFCVTVPNNFTISKQWKRIVSLAEKMLQTKILVLEEMNKIG